MCGGVLCFMSEQFYPREENSSTSRKPRSLRVVFIGIGVAILLFALWFLYLVFLSPEARRDFEDRRNYKQAMESIGAYEEAMRNDTYGGKTPQETLNLFISALEKEDVELASRYFILRSDGTSDMQLLGNIKTAKDNGELIIIINKLKKAEPYKKDIAYETDYKFVVFDDNKEVDVYIDMKFNKYSGVWKIESL